VDRLVLFDNPISSNALKVRFLLSELGIEHERREVPLARPRPQWYLDINPVGGIPAIQDGDLILSESNAILRYLANREGRNDLYPRDAAPRAAVDEFLDRFALVLRPALYSVEKPALGMGAAEVDPAEARRAEKDIFDTLWLFNGLIEDEGYALGWFTIADVAAAPVLYRTVHTGLDLSPFPNLQRWRDTVTARPAFAHADPVR
jgi:glutathione S-transferase